jgi:hypothetical protein
VTRGGSEPQVASDLRAEQVHTTADQLSEHQITVHAQSVGAQSRHVAPREVRRTQRGIGEFDRLVETTIDKG